MMYGLRLNVANVARLPGWLFGGGGAAAVQSVSGRRLNSFQLRGYYLLPAAAAVAVTTTTHDGVKDDDCYY